MNAWVDPVGRPTPRVNMVALDRKGFAVELAAFVHQPDENGQIEVPEVWEIRDGRRFRFTRSVPLSWAEYQEEQPES